MHNSERKQPLEYVDNFSVKKDILSRLVYGELIESPELCIAIPVYGWKETLHETLTSIANQTSSNLRVQVLISNNKVNDDLNQFVQELKKYNTLNIALYFSDRVLGQLANFNRCFELSKCEYVAMVHDDDLLSQNYFSIAKRVLKVLENKKDIAMVHCHYTKFHFESDIHDHEVPKYSMHEISKNAVSASGTSLTGIPSCGCLYRRSAFLKSGGFSLDYPSSGDAFPGGILMTMGYRNYEFDDITGFYRIFNNTSLRLDICKDFISEDFLFGEAWSKKGTVFRKTIMSFFRNYRYSRNIEWKCKMFSSLNSEISVTNLDYRHTYRHYSKYGFKNIMNELLRCYVKVTSKNKVIRF